MYASFSDHDLIRHLNSGDKLAFEEVYNRYWQRLYLFARRLLEDNDEAEDAVQDIFVMLWSNAETMDIRKSLSSFLFTALRNKILKAFEHEKVRNKYISSLQNYLNAGYESLEAEVIEKELALLIDKAVEDLPDRMREVFILSRNEHLTHREISQKLDISENTVKKHINLALKLIKLRITSVLVVFSALFFH